jgi:hypothetical protein
LQLIIRRTCISDDEKQVQQMKIPQISIAAVDEADNWWKMKKQTPMHSLHALAHLMQLNLSFQLKLQCDMTRTIHSSVVLTVTTMRVEASQPLERNLSFGLGYIEMFIAYTAQQQ